MSATNENLRGDQSDTRRAAQRGGGALTRRQFLGAAGLALGGLAVAGTTPLGVQRAEAAALHTYLGNYPEDRPTGWSEDIQGVTHDAGNWFFSQMTALWKLPVGFDLKQHLTASTLPPGGRRVGMPDPLAAMGYDHFGDLDYYGNYLFVPLEGKRAFTPDLGVFRARDLSYVGYAQLREQTSASWCAVNPVTGVLHCSNNTTGVRLGPLYRYPVDLAKVERGWGFLTEGYPTRYLHDLAEERVSLEHIQGGAFRPDGQRLYLQANGIYVFDADYHRIAVSTNTSGTGGFKFEFHTGYDEEPEGLTYWDLNDGRAPNIRGVIHALMVDNDGDHPNDFLNGSDDLYFKHYL